MLAASAQLTSDSNQVGPVRTGRQFSSKWLMPGLFDRFCRDDPRCDSEAVTDSGNISAHLANVTEARSLSPNRANSRAARK